MKIIHIVRNDDGWVAYIVNKDGEKKIGFGGGTSPAEAVGKLIARYREAFDIELIPHADQQEDNKH